MKITEEISNNFFFLSSSLKELCSLSQRTQKAVIWETHQKKVTRIKNATRKMHKNSTKSSVQVGNFVEPKKEKKKEKERVFIWQFFLCLILLERLSLLEMAKTRKKKRVHWLLCVAFLILLFLFSSSVFLRTKVKEMVPSYSLSPKNEIPFSVFSRGKTMWNWVLTTNWSWRSRYILSIFHLAPSLFS